MREGHSSGTDGFEAIATTAKAIGVGSDAVGKLGGRDGLTVAATATNSLWRCHLVAEATAG